MRRLVKKRGKRRLVPTTAIVRVRVRLWRRVRVPMLRIARVLRAATRVGWRRTLLVLVVMLLLLVAVLVRRSATAVPTRRLRVGRTGAMRHWRRRRRRMRVRVVRRGGRTWAS